MKKLMVKFLAACLVISLLPVSTIAAYTIPNYAVSLKTSEERIYPGETATISFNINSEDFLMTDMSVGYNTNYFACGNNTSGVVEFAMPEVKGAQGAAADGNGGYNLATKFTFTAKEVTDTIEVPFTIEAADIVYSYESAKADEPTNVADRTGVSVVIVKRYNVSFVDEDGSTLIGNVQKIDKGLDNEEDTSLSVPAISYDDYVASGLDAAYYEHVWMYNGNEYTDAEVAAFGKAGSNNEITENTTFVLDVREQTFEVTVPSGDFDTTITPSRATYGTDYTGKINPSVYDDKYDYTVKFEIGGNTQEVECSGDSFTIPGENLIGDMSLSYEKTLNIRINAYADYVTGYFLITVNGAADGYTFDGYDMYKSENHNNLRAWIYTPGTNMTEAQAVAAVENLIFTSNTTSLVAPESYDINGSGVVDISDAALTHGAYKGALSPINDWVKEYLCADVDRSFKVDTDDYNEVVGEYKSRN